MLLTLVHLQESCSIFLISVTHLPLLQKYMGHCHCKKQINYESKDSVEPAGWKLRCPSQQQEQSQSPWRRRLGSTLACTWWKQSPKEAQKGGDEHAGSQQIHSEKTAAVQEQEN